MGIPDDMLQVQISIIVPVFNEAQLIQPFLARLRERAPGAEIIVVDAASADGTAQLAVGSCDRLVTTGERSRATQMNAGARVASGDIFWFLHADADVPSGCLDEIGRILRDPTVSGGYFRIRLPPPVVYRLNYGLTHYAGLLLRMRCGDHGIFCRRTAFVHAGGFPDVPIMEDVELFRRLHRHGRVMHSKRRIAVSPRRYEAVGPLRLTLAYGFIATLYLFGLPPSALSRIYQRACCVRDEQTTGPSNRSGAI